jgi:acetyl esterase/lipase
MRTSVMAATALLAASVAPVADAASPPAPVAALDTAALIAASYRVEPNVIYLSTAAWQGKLDLYVPRRPNGAQPTAIVFHGGGWVTGSKDEIALDVLPYLAMGFSVVNVDYRVARVALAPAAVEDARCALRWVVRHAPQYGLDRSRMVMVGSSAGAHLALMAAMAPASAGFDRLCPGDEPLTVAAVINFFGVVDVGELLAPPNPRDFAVGWLGPGASDTKLVERLSPLRYVDKRAPAVLTLHGDADPVVPFTQSTCVSSWSSAASCRSRRSRRASTHAGRSRSPVTRRSDLSHRGYRRRELAHLRQARDQRRQRGRLDRLRRVALVARLQRPLRVVRARVGRDRSGRQIAPLARRQRARTRLLRR